MNTDSFIVEQTDANAALIKRKKIFLMQIVCLLAMLLCTTSATALLLFFVKNPLFFAIIIFLFIGFFACVVWFAAQLRKTEQHMQLFLGEQQSVPRTVRQEENRRKAQYLALQNQINPHFLYNTLEAIRSEAVIGGLSTIADMSETLANFFRYTISNTSGLVTLADEIKNVQDYFTIQRFRFGERIDLDIQIPLDGPLQFYRLPKLILQPIVENAIIHGLEDQIQGGKITINAVTTQCNFFITIEDNGRGINHNKLIAINHQLGTQIRSDSHTGKHSGIAIYNVQERLRLVYGQEYGLIYKSMPQIGTTVEIVLPKLSCEEI